MGIVHRRGAARKRRFEVLPFSSVGVYGDVVVERGKIDVSRAGCHRKRLGLHGRVDVPAPHGVEQRVGPARGQRARVERTRIAIDHLVGVANGGAIELRIGVIGATAPPLGPSKLSSALMTG